MAIPSVLWPIVAVIYFACAPLVASECIMDYMTCTIDYNRVTGTDDCTALKNSVDCFSNLDLVQCDANMQALIMLYAEDAQKESEQCGIPTQKECDVNDYNDCNMEYNGGISAKNCYAIKSGVDCFMALNTTKCNEVMKRTIAFQQDFVTKKYAVECPGFKPDTTTEDPMTSTDDSGEDFINDSAQSRNAGLLVVCTSLLYIVIFKIVTRL